MEGNSLALNISIIAHVTHTVQYSINYYTRYRPGAASHGLVLIL